MNVFYTYRKSFHGWPICARRSTGSRGVEGSQVHHLRFRSTDYDQLHINGIPKSVVKIRDR